jgi:predicted RNA-binding protein Jag
MPYEDLENLTAQVERFVKDLIDKSSLDLRIEVELRDDESLEVMFQGFDLPLLLGHSAELLDALQYVTRRAFADAVAEGVQIDFDGPRQSFQSPFRF